MASTSFTLVLPDGTTRPAESTDHMKTGERITINGRLYAARRVIWKLKATGGFWSPPEWQGLEVELEAVEPE